MNKYQELVHFVRDNYEIEGPKKIYFMNSYCYTLRKGQGNEGNEMEQKT